MKNKYKIKDLAKGTIQTIKDSDYRVWYFSILAFSIIGVITMALSLYYTLSYIAPLFLGLLCLAIGPIMEVYASLSLKEKVRYSLKSSMSATMYGYYHLIFSFLKALLFGSILTSFVWGIIIGIANVVSPGIYDELYNILLILINQSNLPNGVTLEISELASALLQTYNFLNVIFVYCGFLLSHRKNELSNAFSSAYLNDDNRFFLFNPLRKNVFNIIYRQFRGDYNKKTLWSKLIGLFIFTGSLIGGTFIGYAIQNVLPTIDSFYFGVGFGFVIYSLWYGVERTVDAVYVFDNVNNIVSRIPSFISVQMASVKKVYQDGFPNGRFNPSTSPMNQSVNGRFNFTEDTLKKYFFLYYSTKIVDTNFTEFVPNENTSYEDVQFKEVNTPSEKQEKEETANNDNVVGIFGLDDIFGDSKKSDDTDKKE